MNVVVLIELIFNYQFKPYVDTLSHKKSESGMGDMLTMGLSLSQVFSAQEGSQRNSVKSGSSQLEESDYKEAQE